MDTPMDKGTGWLRLSYRVGALADGFFAVAMIHPPLLLVTLGATESAMNVETRLALAMGASLMISWSVLLLWADRRPVERKGVLLMTVFPAIAGLSLTTLYGMTTGYIPMGRGVSLWVFQAALVMLFLYSYYQAPEPELQHGG